MRSWSLGVLLLLGLGAFSSARGAEATSGFYSGRSFKQLTVDKDHVAIQGTAAAQEGRQALLGVKESVAFAQLGVSIVDRAKIRATDAIVGYPVSFSKDAGAVAVLTHEIVVRTDSDAGVKAIKAELGFADLEETTFKKGLYLAKFTSPMAALAAANDLYKVAGVAYAHPNFLIPKDFRQVKRAMTPADEPFFGSQWHLDNTGQFGGTAGADIHAKSAWEVTTGSSDVIVAVLDGGFELTHPDLEGAFFHNAGEIPGNGVDDDHNGYIDDVNGWNYWSKSNDPSAGAYGDHGTAVSGLVGARQNGKGVTGVCPRCTILPVTVAWTPADDAAAFYYANSAGAAVITNSWGYPIGIPATDVVEEAINDVAAHGRGGKGMIVLFAMNNIDQDDCIGASPDISSLESVIAVSGASDMDKKVSNSGWGACMEFLSPTLESGRKGITSADMTGKLGYNTGRNPNDLPDPDYTNDFGGTSAATPIAAGVFALLLSVNDELTRNEALAMVLATADKVQPDSAHYDPRTGFSNKFGYGRINAGKAVRAAQVFRKYTQKDKDKKKTEVMQ